MNKPVCVGFIPARYASTRFPGKPLAVIQGKPMFWHVYSRAKKCPQLKEVVLATDDERIAKAAEDLSVPFVMTDANHASGSDRVFEAAKKFGLKSDDVVVNIQGDEPVLDHQMLNLLVDPFFNDSSVQITTLAHTITLADALNENRVKIALDLNNNALYFSRAAIPHVRASSGSSPQSGSGSEFWGHIGLYAYKLSALAEFTKWSPSPLELREGLEQLRFLEHGVPIRVVFSGYSSQAVDTPEDLEIVEKILQAEKIGA